MSEEDEEERTAAIEDYKNNFSKHFEDVFTFADDSADSVGMLGASFYVLRLGGMKIAIDPIIKFDLLPGLSLETVRNAFASLDGVLLTHEHHDHYDRKLIATLRDLPLKWYVPDFFERDKLAETLLSQDNTFYTNVGKSFHIKEVKITPFDSPHSDPERNTITPEYGYFIESQEKNILFPVDVRVYDPALIPDFGKINNLFIHVWLGAGKALELPCEPKLTEMCDFAASFKPARVFLGHLYEFDRNSDNLWTTAHAKLAEEMIKKLLPDTEVVTLRIGKDYYF